MTAAGITWPSSLPSRTRFGTGVKVLEIGEKLRKLQNSGEMPTMLLCLLALRNWAGSVIVPAFGAAHPRM
jgi:hypothetical protein